RKGRDVEHEVSIPFDLALTGGAYTLRLSFDDEDAETLEVRIPRAVSDGARLRLRGKGQPSPGGERGDLMLTIRVAPHPFYKREGERGLDVVADVPISIVEATLGAKARVRTPGGVVEVAVPAGTASGARLRLRGRGVETDDGRKGDFYAVVKIVPPKGLSEADRAALAEFGARIEPPSGDARA
ncbi:MAG: J domain-containing protein, partial [Phycisphaerales bacterium]|nr:J domain-containing protein [Phycisphaerales bacterium]